MSKIDCLHQTDASIVLFNMMCEHSPDVTEMTETFGVSAANMEVDVVLTVNGVEVDFKVAINNIIRQYDDRFDEAVQEAASRVRTDGGYDALRDKMDTAIRRIEDTIHEAYMASKRQPYGYVRSTETGYDFSKDAPNKADADQWVKVVQVF